MGKIDRQTDEKDRQGRGGREGEDSEMRQIEREGGNKGGETNRERVKEPTEARRGCWIPWSWS